MRCMASDMLMMMNCENEKVYSWKRKLLNDDNQDLVDI